MQVTFVYPHDRLTEGESAAVTALIATMGIVNAGRALGILDCRTLKKAASGSDVHRQTTRTIREALARRGEVSP